MNVFIYKFSPNGGENFLWLQDFNHDSNISVFSSAEDGSYAFLTDTQQVQWELNRSENVSVFQAET